MAAAGSFGAIVLTAFALLSARGGTAPPVGYAKAAVLLDRAFMAILAGGDIPRMDSWAWARGDQAAEIRIVKRVLVPQRAAIAKAWIEDSGMLPTATPDQSAVGGGTVTCCAHMRVLRVDRVWQTGRGIAIEGKIRYWSFDLGPPHGKMWPSRGPVRYGAGNWMLARQDHETVVVFYQRVRGRWLAYDWDDPAQCRRYGMCG